MGSFQSPIGMQSSALLETSCGYLLQELQIIWDEIGEDQFEREKVLLDLERECLEVYRRKVDTANLSRARLHQELAESEAEFTHLLLSLGERSLPGRPEKMAGSLKEQLDSITPALKEMRLRKKERVNQFRAVQEQIHKISAEIAGKSGYDDSPSKIIVNENNLSLNKLEEYQVELQGLQDKKIDRLEQVEKYTSKIRDLSETLGMDYSLILTKVHPSLNDLSGMPKNISDSILATLNGTLKSLEEEKQNRLSKLHQLGKALTNLWDLMDASYEDRHMFSHVTSLLSISSFELSDPGSLTLNIIQQAEAEVKRLDQLKASKMKELFLKKQMELEDICNKSHMEFPSRSEMERILNLINTGDIDHADLLKSMNEQINRAREEASSRYAIMDRVEKWMSARDEERWLDEYNRDENRYSVSRGAHRNLKRAERARVIVNKIPALLDMLIAKTKCWEEQREKVFLYDEIPLLAMLEEYNLLRLQKEKEKQIQREKKKIQNQKVAAPEHLYTPRPGTSSRRISSRSINGGLTSRSHSNRRLASGIQNLGPNSIYFEGEGISFIQEDKKALRQKIFARSSMVSHTREETASEVSALTGPFSP